MVGVSAKPEHGVRKTRRESIQLLEGLGVEGDAHLGETVQHRSRKAAYPELPNLRQVHLLHAELHDELASKGFAIEPGEMGENITTRGIDLLGLPAGTRLSIGSEAVVEVTGLRNPCKQLNGIADGLLDETLDRTNDGERVRKGGIMGIVLVGGPVRARDEIESEPPTGPAPALEPV